jgi:hypothetical protein
MAIAMAVDTKLCHLCIFDLLVGCLLGLGHVDCSRLGWQCQLEGGVVCCGPTTCAHTLSSCLALAIPCVPAVMLHAKTHQLRVAAGSKRICSTVPPGHALHSVAFLADLWVV